MTKPMTIEEARREGLLPVAETRKHGNRRVTKSDRTKLENKFMDAWRTVAKDLPEPTPQYKFHDKRKWRFDFCWGFPIAVAVELQGGGFVRGGHSRGAQQEKDFEKLRAASIAGWIVLQYGSKSMGNSIAVALEVAEVVRARTKP